MRTDRPGYKQSPRAGGITAHYWVPQRAVKGAPSQMKSIRIPAGSTDEEISKYCRSYTAELKLEMANPHQFYRFDGTIKSLIHLYCTDESSPFRSIKHSTRIRDYQPSLRIIEDTVGEKRIDMLKGSDFKRWHANWGSENRARRAQGCIKLLRAILSYGSIERLHGCTDARQILSIIRFTTPKSRLVKMSRAQAYSIVETALDMGLPSIALTQALQWDTAIRRIDLIGQWEPCPEGTTGIVSGATRWKGPTVQNVQDGILRLHTSKSNEIIQTEHDLSECPLVCKVLKAFPLPKIGPLIISEQTGRPWRENYYARAWREVASAAGVPDKVFSMDSRAGAISEAERAAGLDAAQKMATHKNPAMTRKYVRNSDLGNNRNVAQKRAQLESE